jgi:hypothetical protein
MNPEALKFDLTIVKILYTETIKISALEKSAILFIPINIIVNA